LAKTPARLRRTDHQAGGLTNVKAFHLISAAYLS